MQQTSDKLTKRSRVYDENTLVGERTVTQKRKSIETPSSESKNGNCICFSILIFVVDENPVDYAEKGWKVYRINRNKQRLIATFTGETWQIQCAYCNSGTRLCSLSKFRVKKIRPAEKEVEVYGSCPSGKKQSDYVSQIASTLYIPRFQDSDAKLSPALII